jgi:hypothetical protein
MLGIALPCRIVGFLLDARHHRLGICAAWVLSLALALALIPRVLQTLALSHTTSRKLFHL